MSKHSESGIRKVSFDYLRKKKLAQEPFTVLTAYDYTTAGILDEAGIDMLLVGDSLAMTVLGHPNTLSVTLDEMLHHTKAVSRAAKQAMVIGDAPFMSYQISVEESVRNLSRFVTEAHADAVKLEGASDLVLDTTERLTEIGIPVIGHIGFTPQLIKGLGGYKIQGKTARGAFDLVENALALEDAGARAIVLEMVPTPVANLITERLAIPTIGIGAGNGCDAQVLVIDDILGRFTAIQPRFVRRYDAGADTLSKVAKHFQADVESRQFPDNDKEGFSMSQDEWSLLKALIERADQAADELLEDQELNG